MNKPRAISAQLVDIRNVGAHKSIKLTIHVPEEQARQVVDLFGWPTMVDPVPVALARLQEGGGAHAQLQSAIDTTPVSPSDKPAGRAKRAWHAMTPAEQAGIRCSEGAFQVFLQEHQPGVWYADSGDAAAVVRHICRVQSRSQINSANPESLRLWQELERNYRAWQHAPEAGAA